MVKNVNISTGEEEFFIRYIKTSPREHFEGRWKPGRLYPLYSVVVSNGTLFISQNGKMKEEPYVIYDVANQEFKAPEGWKIKLMSADSRISALGGGTEGGVSPEDVERMISGKQDIIVDLDEIRRDASSAYKKPGGGIPKSDLATPVRNSLGKADTALQPNDVLDVVRFSAQSLTTAQKAQARANIGIADALELEYDPVTESLIFPEEADTVSYNSTTESIVFN